MIWWIPTWYILLYYFVKFQYEKFRFLKMMHSDLLCSYSSLWCFWMCPNRQMRIQPWIPSCHGRQPLPSQFFFFFYLMSTIFMRIPSSNFKFVPLKIGESILKYVFDSLILYFSNSLKKLFFFFKSASKIWVVISYSLDTCRLFP